ncbi:hypothetical protein EBU24_04430 [bacterium]|jgi:hypothetical protein|nr:hypothetical protein [bacterium]
MADLVGAIERLKNLLKEKSRKRSASSGNGSNGDNTTENKIEYFPDSSWMISLTYYPMARARSGSVIMRVKKPEGIGYIYPRIGEETFTRWMQRGLRGGYMYWKARPNLRDFSIIARRRGSKQGAWITGRQSSFGGLKGVARKNKRNALRGTHYPRTPSHIKVKARSLHIIP